MKIILFFKYKMNREFLISYDNDMKLYGKILVGADIKVEEAYMHGYDSGIKFYIYIGEKYLDDLNYGFIILIMRMYNDSLKPVLMNH